MPEVFVATQEEACEGGMVLGVFTTREQARAFCWRLAEAAGYVEPPWKGQPGGEEYTQNKGGTYWQIVPFVLDQEDQ